ncbi:Trp biosynthesis-associated membrane protein [Actinomadura flavalba]|uniref:Trp biosynthesis-associated membrane protein n=1 Tax=Actinomadura flavalba TaxID=1120938 RepID=UPI0003A20A9C|nr:Trp biosynthesis-associated membrane protein [Actinomadura flavalba]
MSAGRERGLTALLCAAGAGLTLLAAGRAWATVTAKNAITPFTLDVTGGDLGATAGALGWAALAGLAALFAVGGRGRAVVGALLAAFGAGIVWASVTVTGRADILAAAGDRSALLRLGSAPEVATSPWWLVSAAGGVFVATAGIVTLVRGRRWPGLSARYERRAAAPRDDADPAALWKSLDRGEDPTAAPPDRAARP